MVWEGRILRYLARFFSPSTILGYDTIRVYVSAFLSDGLLVTEHEMDLDLDL